MKQEKPTPAILTKRMIHPNMKHQITLHRDQEGIGNQKLCLLMTG